jgi:hypothetical protein
VAFAIGLATLAAMIVQGLPLIAIAQKMLTGIDSAMNCVNIGPGRTRDKSITRMPSSFMLLAAPGSLALFQNGANSFPNMSRAMMPW